MAATIERKDSASGRFYHVDGHDYPSVTHILQCLNKPALVNWAASEERKLVSAVAADVHEEFAAIKVTDRGKYLALLESKLGKEKAHRRALAKAGDIGTQVHHLIEWQMRSQLGLPVGPMPEVVDDAKWAVMAFEDWAKAVHLEPLAVERIVYSVSHAYAGTLDLLAKVEGTVTVVDFKTGKAVYPEAFLQNVAYQMAVGELGIDQPQRGVILRLPKVQTDPAFEAVPVPPAGPLFPTFLAVKQVWQWWWTQEEANRVAWKAKKDAA
jgi:hypothetical protein